MSYSTILILAVIVLIALFLVLFLLRGRKQHVAFDAREPLVRPAPPAPKVPAAPPASATMREERHGVGSEVTAAIEDVVDQFMGIDAHPSGSEARPGPGDTLTTLKGLGPKAASRLGEIGVTRFEQIAAWDEGDIDAIDAQMGAFKGRIRRDRWVEQARLLAKGDQDGFEAKFGKLGA